MWKRHMDTIGNTKCRYDTFFPSVFSYQKQKFRTRRSIKGPSGPNSILTMSKTETPESLQDHRTPPSS